MKNIQPILSVLILAFIVSMSSCELVGGIFKAGMGFGIFLVVAVIAVIALIVAKASK